MKVGAISKDKKKKKRRKKKRVHGYFQCHGFTQRLQPTVTSNYFLEGGFACCCKMADLTLILCAHRAL